MLARPHLKDPPPAFKEHPKSPRCQLIPGRQRENRDRCEGQGAKTRELEGDTEQRALDSTHCPLKALREPVDAAQWNSAWMREQIQEQK